MIKGELIYLAKDKEVFISPYVERINLELSFFEPLQARIEKLKTLKKEAEAK